MVFVLLGMQAHIRADLRRHGRWLSLSLNLCEENLFLDLKLVDFCAQNGYLAVQRGVHVLWRRTHGVHNVRADGTIWISYF
jgi:hypothetical protein